MTDIIAIRLPYVKAQQKLFGKLIGVKAMVRSTSWSLRSRQRKEHPKHDQRLLRDAGLSPEEAFGPGSVFWSEWRSQRELWQL
jgi:uncharacterized protein YjiS (DUF1127 family)